MKKSVIVTVVGLITIVCMSYLHFRANVAAQTGQENDVLMFQGRIQTFFTSLERSNFQLAYQDMLSGSQLNTIQEIVQKTEAMIKGGTRWRLEFLEAKPVGDDLILIRYLYKCDTHPVIWYFTFYRPQSGTRTWNCIGIRFDTDYDSLFKESWPK